MNLVKPAGVTVPLELCEMPSQRCTIIQRLRRALMGLALISLPLGGCDRVPTGAGPEVLPESLPDDQQVQATLDEVLDWTYQNRHLNLQEHFAWQILHGVLAYKRAFLVDLEPDGARTSALDYLLGGGEMTGWTLRPGIVLDAAADRRGLIADLDVGSKKGQGHADQWLAILAQCALEPSQTIIVGDRTYTMEDFVRQVQWDVPRIVNQEYSWTLIGLSAYLPSTATWTAQDEQTWSIERLVEIETQQDLATSACGGTHRLTALTLALDRHMAAGHPVQGVWSAASEKIAAAVQAARQYQNVDGAFSSNYFQRGGRSADLAQDLGVSGHVLEFLAVALTDEQLSEPWVTRAVLHLCDLLRKARDVPLECGALYHAVNGLSVYRQRMFGPYGPRPQELAIPMEGSPSAEQEGTH